MEDERGGNALGNGRGQRHTDHVQLADDDEEQIEQDVQYARGREQQQRPLRIAVGAQDGRAEVVDQRAGDADEIDPQIEARQPQHIVGRAHQLQHRRAEEEAVKATLSMNGPVYMRIGNPKIPVLFEREPFVIGKGRKITEGEALTLITTGSMTMAAMEAVERLEEEGIQVEHIGMPTVWPIDAELICDSVKKTGRVMTIEEHYIKGGLGTIVMETLNDNGINVPIKMHGIPHCYASNGPYDELMAYYKLDADGVYGGIKEFLKNEEGNK